MASPCRDTTLLGGLHKFRYRPALGAGRIVMAAFPNVAGASPGFTIPSANCCRAGGPAGAAALPTPSAGQGAQTLVVKLHAGDCAHVACAQAPRQDAKTPPCREPAQTGRSPTPAGSAFSHYAARGALRSNFCCCKNSAMLLQRSILCYLKAFSKLGTTCFLRLITPSSHTELPLGSTPKAFLTTEGSSETMSISEPSFMMSVSSRKTL